MLQQNMVDLADRLGAGDDEFFEEWLAHVHAVAVQGVNLLRGVVRFVVAQLGNAAQTALAHHAHIDAGGQGHQPLVGADVAGRFLAADVLLARAQGHHVSASPVLIHRLADDAPGDLAHVLAARGEEAQVRPAEAERDAQRLPLAHDDVRAQRARRLEQAQSERVSHDAQQRAGGVNRAGQVAEVLDLPEEVRVLDDEHSRVFVEHVHQVGQRGAASLIADELQAAPLVIGAGDGAILRVHTGAEDNLAPLAAKVRIDHGYRLGQRGRTVVVTGVGRVHAGEHTHHALVFEDGLQRALAQLRLVGRVGGEELAAPQDVIHDAGHEVVIGARAQEDGVVVGGDVGARQPADFPGHLHLAERIGQVQRGEAELGGHRVEQVVERLDADGGQHRRAVGVGVGNVGHRVNS